MTRGRFRALVAGRWGARALLYSAAVAVASLLLGCGSTTTGTTGTASTRSTAPASSEAKLVPVALRLNEGSYSLSSAGTEITGTVNRGATVTVNGHTVAVHSGHWRDTLQLHLGGNPIVVAATMTGRAPATTTISITRRQSAAELEARARARALRAEEQQHRAAEAREHKEQKEQEKRAEQQQHAEQQTQRLAECTNGTYVNAAGNTVCKPVESSTQPAGASAECEDGTYSFSESRSGTCSHHGGVKRWLHE
jgi:Protein of unknown function (DUF3761)/Glucodextranase, domain B